MATKEDLPPAQPVYVLRGHQSQIHALAFYADNLRLLSADADGFVLSWDMLTKRPVAGWKAHDKAILGIAAWDRETIISHGRDSRLVVWRLDQQTETLMHQYVPADQLEESTAKPTILQEMTINTMNFCSFAWCDAPLDMAFAEVSLDEAKPKPRRPILLAVPNTLESEAIDVYYMPSMKRKSTIKSPEGITAGMAMAIVMSANTELTTAVGYESGHVLVFQHDVSSDMWKTVYMARPHTQPVLSMCLHPDLRVCLSTSADSLVAKHPFGDQNLLEASKDTPIKLLQTKHAGQQGLAMRNDGRIFSTAGWDARIRVYSAKTMKELAVLKYHKQGCYETALANVDLDEMKLKVAQAQGQGNKAPIKETPVLQEAVNAGSDILVPATPERSVMRATYERKIRKTHWLAAGSKDGNISLWDVF